jgi:hypothetical protein
MYQFTTPCNVGRSSSGCFYCNVRETGAISTFNSMLSTKEWATLQSVSSHIRECTRWSFLQDAAIPARVFLGLAWNEQSQVRHLRQVHQIPGKWPYNLKTLSFDNTFNQPLSVLPCALTHLIFGENFNQPILLLPSTLTMLVFGKNFNQWITTLPSSLTYLAFGQDFHQPILAYPARLTHLLFGSYFNRNTDLPAGLLYLTFGPYHEKPLEMAKAMLDWQKQC